MTNYKKLSVPGEIVAQRRHDLGLNQAELAKKLAYRNVNFISMLESGDSRVPLERSVDFAKALEIDVKWFIERVMRDRPSTIAIADFIFGAKRSQ